MKKDDLSKFIEEAVGWRVFRQTLEVAKPATPMCLRKKSTRRSTRHSMRFALSAFNRAPSTESAAHQCKHEFAVARAIAHELFHFGGRCGGKVAILQ
jgi:hypothetical protein